MNTDTKAVAVNVSKGDISSGKRGNSEKCMVHHALRRVINDNVEFEVDGYNVAFTTERSIALPPFVRDIIGVWDCGRDVAPFSFNLSIPTHILKPRYAKSG